MCLARPLRSNAAKCKQCSASRGCGGSAHLAMRHCLVGGLTPIKMEHQLRIIIPLFQIDLYFHPTFGQFHTIPNLLLLQSFEHL